MTSWPSGVTLNEIVMATYPGDKKEMTKAAFRQPQRHKLSDDELKQIHSAYEDEAKGVDRRGNEIRFWEDTEVGEKLPALIKGPYDISDAVSFFGMTSYSYGFAAKYHAMKYDYERLYTDPETGEKHMGADWHFSDSIAQAAGLPFAQIFGTHIESCLAHMVSNWMGDDARLVKLDTQIRAMMFLGDVFICKGDCVPQVHFRGW